MTTELEIVSIGNASRGIVLPEEVLSRLGIQPGDTFMLTEDAGSIMLSRCPFEDSVQMRMIRRVMQENREVLKMLADS
jgi:putative addiction module antidote